MKTCETCAKWDIINAQPAHDRMHYANEDTDYEHFRPPHADLKWSECNAALEGFDFDTKEDYADFVANTKMAVFDGSAYYATLYTRFDHVCGDYKEREHKEVTGDE